MKNNKFLKVSLMILSLALVIGAVFAVTVSADEATDYTPKIISQNIDTEGNFHLYYAVSADNIPAGSTVTLKVYAGNPDIDPENVPTILATVTADEPETITIADVEYSVYTFRTNGIAAKEMATQYYIQAEVTVEGTVYKSEVKRYSVAEYLYQKLSETGLEEAHVNFLKSIIAFGDNAQIWFDGKSAETDDLISELRYVTVEGGKLDTYFTNGVYAVGSTLPLTSNDENAVNAKWTVNAYTFNEDRTNVSTAAEENVFTADVKVQDADKTEVVLGESISITYREGTQTFSDYEAGKSSEFKINNKTLITTTTVEDIGGKYGNVVSYARAPMVYCHTTPTDFTDVIGYEFSYDMKITMNCTEERTYLQWIIQNTFPESDTKTGYTNLRFNFEFKTNGVERETILMNNVDSGIKPGEWFHIRYVIPKDEAKIYAYINGSDTPLTSLAITNSNYNFETIYDIKGSLTGGTVNNITMDNVFSGYYTTTLEEEAAKQAQ